MAGSNKPNVVVLLGRRADSGVWKFLRFHEEYVGIPIRTSKNIMNIKELICSSVETALGSLVSDSEVKLLDRYEPLLVWPDGGSSVLMLAELMTEEACSLGHWMVLPEILRKMPKTRNRVAFMKVFQSLSVASEDECQAVELTKGLVEELFPEKQ